MITVTNNAACSGCHACASVCPKRCIIMSPDDEGFLYPRVDSEKCLNCGLCNKACPIITPNAADSTNKKAYAAQTSNLDVRLKSSSGGIFTELANYIISKGGVVFGAATNKDLSISHKVIDKVEDLELLRGSKYVQSSIGNSYEDAKKILTQGRLVLFTGTPCQISGLLSFLGKKYDNLYTQDIICHGVPSPLAWQSYVKAREAKARSNATAVCFRYKNSGWRSFSLQMEFENGKSYVSSLYDDPYMKGFLKNLYLRPSCYECAFKGLERSSDITLADFWGIENVAPDIDDNCGTSLVIINTEAGHQILNSISERLILESVDIDVATSFNAAMYRAPSCPIERKFIMNDLKEGLPFDKAISRHIKRSPISNIKRFIKSVIKRILVR